MQKMRIRRAVALGLVACVAVLGGCQAAPGSPTPPERQIDAAATTAPSVATEPAATRDAGPEVVAPTAPAAAVTAPAATPTADSTVIPLPEQAGLPVAEASVVPAEAAAATFEVQEYDVPKGSHPHDVAPAVDGGVWYTAQAGGALGWLDPATGETEHIPLGQGSAPHGVITGPDGAAWITDSGLNAMVRVDPDTREVKRYDLPSERRAANLNTAVFDPAGRLWFTGQSGVYGSLDPATGEMRVFDAPKGRGPYGITATADGKVYYASLAGSYLGEIDPETGEATVLEPPTAGQGARRSWADSSGKVWVSSWNAGQLARYDPSTGAWTEWRLPGDGPRAYSVYVDWQDKVWLSDFGNNSLVRFDPQTEEFETIPLPSPSASVRQIHGRPGEIWGAESAVDKLVVVRVR
jgi:virginiamycin B lyase